jgi:hypothetical protein
MRQIGVLKAKKKPAKPVNRRPPPLSRGRGTASSRILAEREAER